MPFNHFILSHPLLFLPLIFPSIRVFSNESALHKRWPKYWSFNFSISLSNEYSGLISFRIDWFDLAVHGTFKSLLQHHSLKASVLQHSTFLMVQLSQGLKTQCQEQKRQKIKINDSLRTTETTQTVAYTTDSPEHLPAFCPRAFSSTTGSPMADRTSVQLILLEAFFTSVHSSNSYIQLSRLPKSLLNLSFELCLLRLP